MRYGLLEFAYAEPFAVGLAEKPDFPAWVISQTKFASQADGARVLVDEMTQRRTKSASNWWRSHYTEACRCTGCRGQETDILAVFQAATGRRFAIHFEVKQPTDRFPADKDQAANYGLRAACWVRSPPKAVVPHEDATTVLLCSKTKLGEFVPHISKFHAVITLEEAAERL